MAILDVETTGLSAQHDVIIELAIMLCFLDDEGEVIGHLGPFSWLQDPGRELDPKISLVTGLRAQDVAGQKINDAFAIGLGLRDWSGLARFCCFANENLGSQDLR